MSVLPYPTLIQSPTQTSTTKAIFGVGRVRIHPLTCPGNSDTGEGNGNNSSKALSEYEAIISKCIQQSQETDSKTRKKYMKQGVALASSYLSSTLNIDVSIVDVEIVLNVDCINKTDGCLASCFLDAGCAYVVVRVKEEDGNDGLDKALEAIDTTRLPKERLILHYKSNMKIEMNDTITSRVGTISIQMDVSSLPCTDWSNIVTPSKEYKSIVQISLSDDISNEDMIASISSLSKAIGENKGSITLVDPTAEQLGLSYAACMKTDREDGLYTTVVVTRSNEALG